MTKAKFKTTQEQGMLHRQPTLADVAKLAGVSLMTVSRSLKRDPLVSERTRRKVVNAVAALNYVPNQGARTLVGVKPIRVGFLYSSSSSAFLSELLLGLLGQSSFSNVQLLIEKCESVQHEEAHVRRLVGQGVDGIVLAPPLCDSDGVISCVSQAGIPAVAVGCGKPDQRISAVSIDDYDAAFRMTSHLIALGHERIGFVAGHPDQTGSERRLAGYRAAITAKGISMSEDLVAQGLFTYLSGLDAAERLLSLEKRPTAIFASSEDMAVAVVDVAHRFELKIPADLTVAGFGDTALATSIWPALTTVRQPIADMASAALQSLVRRVRALRNGEQAPPEHVCADFLIVRRQSDAAPRFNPQVHQSILDAVSAIRCPRADN